MVSEEAVGGREMTAAGGEGAAVAAASVRGLSKSFKT
jgi:hypothetical protein